MTLKNIAYGSIIFLLGIISIWACDGDISFMIFSIVLGLGIFFTKEPFDDISLEESDE